MRFGWIIFLTSVQIINGNFIKRSMDHDYPGRSLGRVKGVEKYEYEGHIYSFHLKPRTWEEASAVCRYDGGYLAVLEDAFEVSFVGNAMDGNLCSNTVFQNVWLGARFSTVARRWLWTSTGYEVIGAEGDVTYPPWDLVDKPESNCLNLQQDLTHRPKFANLDCKRKRRFLCEYGCTKLYDTDRGVWEPEGCLLDPASTGDTCHLVCHPGLELDGANPLTCSPDGWNNTIGSNAIPDCKGPDEIAEDILEELFALINERKTALFFIVDEAVEEDVFSSEISFIRRLLQNYPPSESQLVSIIKNSKAPRVVVPPKAVPLCSMLELLSNLHQNKSEVSDPITGLIAAKELASSSPSASTHTPIFFIISSSKGESTSEDVAANIKEGGGVIITVGIGDFDADQLIRMSSVSLDGPLHFGLTNPKNFEKVIHRLEPGALGNKPCYTNVERIKKTMTRSIQDDSNILFLLDLSASWSSDVYEQILSFIQTVVTMFPLSKSRKGGLILASAHARLEIPLRAEDSCIFNRHVGKLASPSVRRDSDPHTDTAGLVKLELKRHGGNSSTVVVVLSDNRSNELKAEIETLVDNVFNIDASDANDVRDVLHYFESSDSNDDLLSLETTSLIKLEKVVQYFNESVEHGQVECSTVCSPLNDDSRGMWLPNEELDDCSVAGRPGLICSLSCNEEYELVGSNPLVCTDQGWTGTDGDDVRPNCMTPEEVAIKFMEKIGETLQNEVNSNLMFLVDESGSVTLPNFRMEMDFVSAIVDAFPLSSNRSAGLAVFSDKVRVPIAVIANNTCRFLRSVKRVKYRGGQTDIKKGLTVVREELRKRAVHPQSLVFLITDGISQTDPSEAAAVLRDEGAVLFVIGVAEYQYEQLEPLASIGPDGTTNFFGVKSFKVFEVISRYLNSRFRADGVDCPS